MNEPKFLEKAEGYCILRPVGALPMLEVVKMITAAISFARSEGVRRLLVVLTDVTGLTPPRLAARYEFVHEWAQASSGLVRLVIVTTAEMIEPGKFGVTMAANAGMTANVFEDEEAALAWLLSDAEGHEHASRG